MNNIKKNIRYLLKINGINIGDFEREHGVPAGRLARPAELPFDLAYRMAKTLGVTLESLVEQDYELEQEIIDLEREIESKAERLEALKERLAEMKEGGSNEC